MLLMSLNHIEMSYINDQISFEGHYHYIIKGVSRPALLKCTQKNLSWAVKFFLWPQIYSWRLTVHSSEFEISLMTGGGGGRLLYIFANFCKTPWKFKVNWIPQRYMTDALYYRGIAFRFWGTYILFRCARSDTWVMRRKEVFTLDFPPVRLARHSVGVCAYSPSRHSYCAYSTSCHGFSSSFCNPQTLPTNSQPDEWMFYKILYESRALKRNVFCSI